MTERSGPSPPHPPDNRIPTAQPSEDTSEGWQDPAGAKCKNPTLHCSRGLHLTPTVQK